MQSGRYNTPQDICDAFCQCSVCINNNSILKSNQEQKKQTQINKYSFHTFLQFLPKNFSMSILATVCYKQKAYYFNKFSNHIMIVPLGKLTEHFPLAINVTLFYPNKSNIVHKYQISKTDNSFNYVQVYNTALPFTVSYHREDNFMDEVLQQKLQSLVKSLQKDENYDFTPQEKDFLSWVHKDYQDMIFCKYMAKIYCRFIQKTKYQSIVSAQFQWIIQKLGNIRLSNVKFMVTQKIQKSATFQQEYQQKVLEKLNSYGQNDSMEIKLFNVFVTKSRINNRIQKFKNQIRDIFQKQKIKILQKTQKQRTVQSKSLSDDVARLFLPQLHNYSSLRQVLNDEKKFKKVVLGIDQQVQTNTTDFSKIKIRKPRNLINSQLSISKNKNVITRHHQRSKTQT